MRTKQPSTSPTDEGFSRPPLQRMMRLHAALKSHHFPNCRKIAVELEVSPKTIQRDIDFMRDRLGLPIGYDAQQFGFYYTEAVTGFPSIEVSEGEITALFVAQKALAQYKGTPFERPLHSAFRRITLTTKGFRRPADFSITKILSGSFGVFSSGRKYRIRLQFDSYAARLVSARSWHGAGRIRALPGGS